MHPGKIWGMPLGAHPDLYLSAPLSRTEAHWSWPVLSIQNVHASKRILFSIVHDKSGRAVPVAAPCPE